MPPFRRVSPAEAKSLLDLGYTYVDVRTPPEFDAGHPAGALNVPLTLPGPSGPTPNPDFLPAMLRLFARDGKIVVGCAAGVRSELAAEMLVEADFSEVVDQRAGYNGARSPFGGVVEPGWADAGLPVARGGDAGSYEALSQRGSR